MTRGRKSKIDVYNLSRQIDVLRSEGLNLQQIADTINKDIPEVRMTKNDISRHITGKTQSTSNPEERKIVDYVIDRFNDIDDSLIRSKIPATERSIIRKSINLNKQRIISEVKKLGVIDMDNVHIREAGNLIMAFSNELCLSCREKVSHAISELNPDYKLSLEKRDAENVEWRKLKVKYGVGA